MVDEGLKTWALYEATIYGGIDKYILLLLLLLLFLLFQSIRLQLLRECLSRLAWRGDDLDITSFTWQLHLHSPLNESQSIGGLSSLIAERRTPGKWYRYYKDMLEILFGACLHTKTWRSHASTCEWATATDFIHYNDMRDAKNDQVPVAMRPNCLVVKSTTQTAGNRQCCCNASQSPLWRVDAARKSSVVKPCICRVMAGFRGGRVQGPPTVGPHYVMSLGYVHAIW